MNGGREEELPPTPMTSCPLRPPFPSPPLPSTPTVALPSSPIAAVRPLTSTAAIAVGGSIPPFLPPSLLPSLPSLIDTSDRIRFKREFCVFEARGIEAAAPFSRLSGGRSSEEGRKGTAEEVAEEVRVKG